MKYLGVIALVLCLGLCFSSMSFANDLFAEKPGLETKIGVKGGISLQAIPGQWSNARPTPGIGLTVENNLFHFNKGMFDLGFMLDVYYVQKGATLEVGFPDADDLTDETIIGDVNADWLAIPIFLKFRYAKGFMVGPGWIIPGIIAGFENNIFLSTEYRLDTAQRIRAAYIDETPFKYFFYDKTKLSGGSSIQDSQVEKLNPYIPGFQVGLSISYLFDYGEITLDVKYAMDIFNELPQDNLVVPLGADTRLSYGDEDPQFQVPIPAIQSQGLMFYLSYSVPLSLFTGKKVYSDYKRSENDIGDIETAPTQQPEAVNADDAAPDITEETEPIIIDEDAEVVVGAESSVDAEVEADAGAEATVETETVEGE